MRFFATFLGIHLSDWFDLQNSQTVFDYSQLRFDAGSQYLS